jgi:hypothetical protein
MMSEILKKLVDSIEKNALSPYGSYAAWPGLEELVGEAKTILGEE